MRRMMDVCLSVGPVFEGPALRFTITLWGSDPGGLMGDMGRYALD